MYIKEYEFFNIFVLNKKKKQFLDKILNIQSEVGEEYKVHWSFLKKSSLRRNKIKVKCDDCQNIIEKRLCDIYIEKNEHFCRSCGKKGNRNGIFGLYGDKHHNYGVKREDILGDKNPSKLIEVRDKISKANSLSNSEFIKRLKVRNLFNYDHDYTHINYINTLTKVKVICKRHGIFYIKPINLIQGSTCEFCKKISKGESKIEKILKEKNVKYILQKTFDKCRGYKRPLPFDFYLPDYNTCIEFDGIQHFRPVEIFGGIERFNELIKNDTIKNEYCQENNIGLIRISYKEKTKIQHIIEEKLKL